MIKISFLNRTVSLTVILMISGSLEEDSDEGFMKLIWSVTVLLDVSLNFIKQSRGSLF